MQTAQISAAEISKREEKEPAKDAKDFILQDPNLTPALKKTMVML